MACSERAELVEVSSGDAVGPADSHRGKLRLRIKHQPVSFVSCRYTATCSGVSVLRARRTPPAEDCGWDGNRHYTLILLR